MRWNYSSIVPIWVNECSVFWDAAIKLPAPSQCWLLWTWWRHQMETFSALLALCAGNSPVPVNSPHKSQWHGALMFSFICVWINDWVNNREAGDLRRQHGHYDVNIMKAGAMAWDTSRIIDPLWWKSNDRYWILLTKDIGLWCFLCGRSCWTIRPRGWCNVTLKRSCAVMYLGQVTKLRLSYYLVLLSIDSKTR